MIISFCEAARLVIVRGTRVADAGWFGGSVHV